MEIDPPRHVLVERDLGADVERRLLDLGAGLGLDPRAGSTALFVLAGLFGFVDAVAVVRDRHADVDRTADDEAFRPDKLFDERVGAFFRAGNRGERDAESQHWG